LYINVVQYKGGKVVPAWYCNNIFFTAAFKEVLKGTSGVDLGFEWLNYAMKFMVDTKTRDTCFGADVQKLCQEKWPVTHKARYLKRGDTHEYKVARVKAVSECVVTYLSESVGGGDDMYYPFEEAFREQVSPGLLKLLETDGFVKLRDIGIKVGTTKILDELCMDNFICDACFIVLV
jgi:acetamidase/formamidase